MNAYSKFNIPASFVKAVLLTGLIAGILDILSAIFILAGGNATGTLTYIASAVLGTAAFNGGFGVVLLGLGFHFIIAYSFTILYFWLYPRSKVLQLHPLLSAVLYGLFTWMVMNLLVVPLTKIPRRPLVFLKAALNMAILVIMIGLPVALLAKAYYKKKAG